MPKQHTYRTRVVWTGNTGTGTSGYRDYARDHEVSADGPPPFQGSADPAFRGDPGRWNPEQLLLASLSQCHMLSYLALCSLAGLAVTAYEDDAEGTMSGDGKGGGQFTEAVLRPHVEVASADLVDRARELHAEAHAKCFIANSVNFPVRNEPVVTVRGDV
ncbi:OsmC family protein [Streptomyces sp. MST-110588]|uniref:OsmC family protein n=1 Tax=Streptomyces sp. MST-110588 TaxID=2833628 RepID=UPI001F5DAC93|nr:OsmC family protein [Streptomyces sp. MST-110588]UNO40234.1 OsmC family protein [Streptomyces sp. MST-110588]